jgi:acyl carrier protein
MIETVKQILRDTLQLGERVERFTAETPLLGSIPEIDSMAVVTILTLFEDEFGVSINDDEVSAATFETVGSLARFLEERV